MTPGDRIWIRATVNDGPLRWDRTVIVNAVPRPHQEITTAWLARGDGYVLGRLLRETYDGTLLVIMPSKTVIRVRRDDVLEHELREEPWKI